MENRTIKACQLEDRDSRAAGLEAPGKASGHAGLLASLRKETMSGSWPFSDKGHQVKFYTGLGTLFFNVSFL